GVPARAVLQAHRRRLHDERGGAFGHRGGGERGGDDRRLRALLQQVLRSADQGHRGGRDMRRPTTLAVAAALFPLPAFAAAPGQANTPAIVMFLVFIVATMGITWWAARRTRTTADFYTAGGGITGFQNGLAISGDYLSAASFLGIAGMVYVSGFDGMIYAIGFLFGWPVVMFLIAERLRNLGRYNCDDVTSFRLGQTRMRVLASSASLLIIALYLIAQMVGAGKLIVLLFGIQYNIAVFIVGALMMV